MVLVALPAQDSEQGGAPAPGWGQLGQHIQREVSHEGSSSSEDTSTRMGLRMGLALQTLVHPKTQDARTIIMSQKLHDPKTPA